MSFFIGSIESWNLSKGKEIIFHFHCEKPDDYDFSIIPHDGNLSFQMRKKLIKPNLAEIVVITYPNMNWSPGTNDGKFHVQAKHKKTNKIIDSPINTVIGNLDNGINQDEIKIINDSTFVLPVPKEQVQGVFGTYGKIAYTSNKIGKDLSEIRLNYEGRHSRTIIFELLKNGRQCYLKLANDKIPQKRICICKINQYGDRYKIESSKSKDLEIVPVDARQLRIERLDEHLYRLNGEGYFKIIERLESYQFDTFYYKTNDRITEMD